MIPQIMRHATVSSAKAVQAMTRSLPVPLCGQLRRTAEWCERMRPAAPVGEWSTPLIATDSRGAEPLDLLTGTGAVAVKTSAGASAGTLA